MADGLPPDAPRICALLERLVAFDTQNPPGQEAEAARFLAATVAAFGFAAELQNVAMLLWFAWFVVLGATMVVRRRPAVAAEEVLRPVAA